MKVLRSDCCEQPVVADVNYWELSKSSNKELSVNYICIKCQEPCNAIEIEVKDWVNTK